MLLTMFIVVFEMIALVFQCIKRLVFDFPPGTTTSHKSEDIPLVDPQVCDPAEVLALALAHLPVLDEIDPHVAVRGIEWHIIDKPKAVTHPASAVMAFIIGDAPGLFRLLDLPEQKGMIACFDAKNIVQIMVLQRLDVRRIRT